jgi:gas vesicle protein
MALKLLWKARQRRRIMNRDGLANFLLGLGIGVGLGMLFAPKSGEETRDLLLSKADEGKEFLKKQTADLKDNAGDLLNKGREAMGRQKETLNDAIEAGKQAYREKVEQSAPAETASCTGNKTPELRPPCRTTHFAG